MAAAPLAAAAAALEALLLGRFGLGGEPLALAGAAGLTAAAALALPRPDAAGVWGSLDRREKAIWGAVAGVGLVWVAWILRRPLIGIDGITYQLAEAVSWVGSGDTGSAVSTFYDIPTAAYPLTNEVLLSWVVGISGSLAPALLVGPALTVAAGRLGVARAAAAGRPARRPPDWPLPRSSRCPSWSGASPSRAPTSRRRPGWRAARRWWPARPGVRSCWGRRSWPRGWRSGPRPLPCR